MIIDCSIENIKYGANSVIENVNFQLNNGDCLMVTGDSGSGKTTILLFISGLLEKKHASIEGFCSISPNTKLVYIAQNPDSNIISNDVKSELLLYCAGDVLKICTLLIKYNIPDDFINKMTNELSGGQQQLLAVLCGIIQDVDLYVLDEPTAMLDDVNTLIVSEIIKELLSNNKTVIISTHNKAIFSFANKHLELNAKFKRYQNNIFDNKTLKIGKVTLRLEDIHFSYKKREIIIKGLNLSLSNNDILLISGNNGTGKTTLAKLLAGLLKPQKGVITFNEQKIKKVPLYLPVVFSYSQQNPNWQLLFESVEKEVNYSINKFLKENSTSHTENLTILLANTNINQSKEPRELSFGQKKFISNFSFYHDPIIHFFDEPDLGIDEVFNNYFLDYLAYRKAIGLISIIVSHNVDKYKSIVNKQIILS